MAFSLVRLRTLSLAVLLISGCGDSGTVTVVDLDLKGTMFWQEGPGAGTEHSLSNAHFTSALVTRCGVSKDKQSSHFELDVLVPSTNPVVEAVLVWSDYPGPGTLTTETAEPDWATPVHTQNGFLGPSFVWVPHPWSWATHVHRISWTVDSGERTGTVDATATYISNYAHPDFSLVGTWSCGRVVRRGLNPAV